MSELHAIYRRRGRRPVPVLLDATDEKLLREVAASPAWNLSQTRRAAAVLGIATGLRQGQLAGEIGYSAASIRRSCRRFQMDGVAGLLAQRQRTGRPRSPRNTE